MYISKKRRKAKKRLVDPIIKWKSEQNLSGHFADTCVCTECVQRCFEREEGAKVL